MAFQRNFEDLGVQGGWNDPPDAAWKIKSLAGDFNPWEGFEIYGSMNIHESIYL